VWLALVALRGSPRLDAPLTASDQGEQAQQAGDRRHQVRDTGHAVGRE
jgi:hypothetical protein